MSLDDETYAYKWFRIGWDKRGEVEGVIMTDDYDLSQYDDDEELADE